MSAWINTTQLCLYLYALVLLFSSLNCVFVSFTSPSFYSCLKRVAASQLKTTLIGLRAPPAWRCALTNLFKHEPCLCLCCEFCNLISVYSHQQSANLKTPGWCNQNHTHTHREFASFRWNERPSNYPVMSVINLIKHVYLTHVCLQTSYHTELADWMCVLRFRHKGEVGPMQETEPERQYPEVRDNYANIRHNSEVLMYHTLTQAYSSDRQLKLC